MLERPSIFMLCQNSALCSSLEPSSDYSVPHVTLFISEYTPGPLQPRGNPGNKVEGIFLNYPTATPRETLVESRLYYELPRKAFGV
jgi:hypothetical protein